MAGRPANPVADTIRQTAVGHTGPGGTGSALSGASRARKQQRLANLNLFLSRLSNTTGQLTRQRCWERNWEWILALDRRLEAACRAWFVGF